MQAQYLTIDDKHRSMTGRIASLGDFSVSPGAAASLEAVRDNPTISLYCLDDVAGQAIFAELPPDVDLARAPFVYQEQYEQATSLIAVPYDTFRRLAADLPAVERLVMIYSTARSGSTLLSHMFNALDGVRSLSEPDVATQFVHLRAADGTRDAELSALLDSAVRFLFKPSAAVRPSTYALKLRSEGVQLMDLYQLTFPGAVNLYSQRDAIGFVRSFMRIFERLDVPPSRPLDEAVAEFREIQNVDLGPLTRYLDERSDELSLLQYLTLWWIASIEWYLKQQQRGISALAVGYDDVSTYRERVVAAILEYCGLPPASAAATRGAFERDSQAGTSLARDDPAMGNQLQLSDAQLEQIGRITRRHPIIQSPGFAVPGTLQV